MYRRVETRFWTDPKVRKLLPDSRLLFLYYITSPHGHFSGIFHCPDLFARQETGLSRARFDRSKGELAEAELVVFDTLCDTLWIPHGLKYQGAKGERLMKAVAANLTNIHSERLIRLFMERYDTLSIPYTIGYRQDSIQDSIQEQDSSSLLVAAKPSTEKENGEITEARFRKAWRTLFVQFYADYPRKGHRPAAEVKWMARAPTFNAAAKADPKGALGARYGEFVDRLNEIIDEQAGNLDTGNKQFIAYADAFLNKEF